MMQSARFMMLFWRRWIGNMHRGYQLQLAWIVPLQMDGLWNWLQTMEGTCRDRYTFFFQGSTPCRETITYSCIWGGQLSQFSCWPSAVFKECWKGKKRVETAFQALWTLTFVMQTRFSIHFDPMNWIHALYMLWPPCRMIRHQSKPETSSPNRRNNREQFSKLQNHRQILVNVSKALAAFLGEVRVRVKYIGGMPICRALPFVSCLFGEGKDKPHHATCQAPSAAALRRPSSSFLPTQNLLKKSYVLCMFFFCAPETTLAILSLISLCLAVTW